MKDYYNYYLNVKKLNYKSYFVKSNKFILLNLLLQKKVFYINIQFLLP